ncbi:diacylglycerol/lipid kinase family protein [Ilumatobacter nonamiensis]|uniref:diacylglycerol/lipid kinase family protein n=1 Tax=Ilumatobacter nonamiensis TaxID=467093 RepID=UPI000684F182|nr:YegS/Rv2252/BmrU family lipid kinase [Ilumatobacter nonamiensis]
MGADGSTSDGRPVTVGVIVNEGKELGGGLEELRSALADAGHPDPPWYEVSKSKKAPKKIRKLVEEHGVDRVLMWGGDGTVRRAINTIIDEGYDDVAIGILPAGTANLLANNLDIPIDLRGAVDIAVSGDPRAIDVGEMNGTYFAVMAGTGFDAMLIRDADDGDLKERFGRVGYVVAGMRNRDVSPAHAVIEVDGKPWYTGDASCVIVANIGTILGGLEAFPDASPTDGRLDVGVVEARSSTEWLRLLTSATFKRAHKSPLTKVVTAEKLTVSLDRSLPWEVDGGDRDRTNEFEIRCVPQAIRICQPWTADTGEKAP